MIPSCVNHNKANHTPAALLLINRLLQPGKSLEIRAYTDTRRFSEGMGALQAAHSRRDA